MALPAPANPAISTTAPWTILADGSLLNIATVMRVLREKNAVKFLLVDGSTVVASYVTPPNADDGFQLVAQALGAAELSAPAINSITPATAAAGTDVTAVIRGRSFEDGGSVEVGGSPASITFVDATTLLVVWNAPEVGLQDVVYTSPSAVTATLEDGFEVT